MSSIKSPFPYFLIPGFQLCCGSLRMILVLSNQVEIMAKSPGQERRNPILDDWTPVLDFYTEHCSEGRENIQLSPDRETKEVSPDPGTKQGSPERKTTLLSPDRERVSVSPARET